MKPVNPIRLAIADDHAMFRRGVMAVIGRMNVCFVAEATNGQELLDKIAALDELPQICILDINMPVMDGHEALRQIKSRWPSIRVLILSMLQSEATARNMLQQGAAAYLLKDGPPEELERAIGQIVENGRYDSVFSKQAVRRAQPTSGNERAISEREEEFLRWNFCDLNYNEIALRMGIDIHHVDEMASDLSRRLGVKSRIGLVNAAARMGILPAE